jgi:PAB1-binding protein PBP1
MMTDTEISRFDGRQTIRDKELVPWEAECGDSLEELEDHNNGTNAQNGWDPDDMFKTNEERFKVRSTYEPTLKDYT